MSWFKKQFEDPAFQEAFNKERAVGEFTQQILHVLKSKGHTKADLAEALECSRPHITQLLRGEGNPSVATMSKLATACGYELHILLRKQTSNTKSFVVPEGEEK